MLIVEDERQAGDRLSGFFAGLGFSVCKVRCAGDAVALCGHFPPDVAVVDLSGPEGTGYELARYIRERRAEAVLIVATTPQGFKMDWMRSQRAGIDHHFTKSADLDVLRSLVGGRGPGGATRGA